MTATQEAEWSKVATCEEGGRNDPQFGYFGIYPSSWQAFGGSQFSAVAGGATFDEQVIVGERIEGDGYVPDQGGCAGGW